MWLPPPPPNSMLPSDPHAFTPPSPSSPLPLLTCRGSFLPLPPPIPPRQVGLLYLAYPNGAGPSRSFAPQKVRPSAHLTVRWEVPAGVVEGAGRPRQEGGGGEPQRLMVGLFRLGVGSNTAGIISKKLFERPPRPCRDPRQVLFGTVPFYAPKSVSAFNLAPV